MTSTDDTRYMALALQLADLGRYSTHPNPRVGCVVVRDGEVVGQGWHEYAGGPHAEINALNEAAELARGATVYVTLEPCSHQGKTPPCADALIRAGVARVVVACADPNPEVAGQGLERLSSAGIETCSGVLETQARALNPGFLRVMAGGRPWVRVKMAASLDGRTAMASGESQWITGAEARSDVQRLRARSSAIVTGIGTALADDPALTVRPSEMGELEHHEKPVTQPLRVVLDAGLRLPPAARIVSGPGRCVVMTLDQPGRESMMAALEQAGARVVALPASPGDPSRLDLAAVMDWLGSNDCREILIEAGPGLAGAVMAAELVDEFWLYQAPTLLGSNARPMLELPLQKMAEQHRLEVMDRRVVGADQRLILRPAPQYSQH